MKILLIEDEQSHCEEYKKCITYLPYEVELHVSNGFKKGAEEIIRPEWDLIILDLEFNESDGDGIMLLNELKGIEFNTVPYIIIITKNISRKTHELARKSGADYIFVKTKSDYSPRLVLDFAHNYMKKQSRKPIVKITESLETKVAREIEKIGVTNDMSGKIYLIDAILIVLNLYKNNYNASNINLNMHVYPVIAKKYKKSIGCIEQGIKNAINKAWMITDIDILIENYTATVSYRTGHPTNSELIFFYADKLSIGNKEREYMNRHVQYS